jgi:hypothetical protein
MPHGRRCGPALQPTAVHTCFFTLPHTHHTPTVYAGDAGTAGRQRRKHPSYLPLQILDRPGPHYWSPVHVSSRRLALVPQVQGLLLNARSQFDSYLRDRWASFDETKATCLYYDWKCYCCLFFIQPGPGSDMPTIACPNEVALRLVRSRPS